MREYTETRYTALGFGDSSLTKSSPQLPEFDIFVSYRSEDSAYAEKLRTALKRRGVRVWVDKNEIRPGDLFIESLEKGLESSRCLGLIATPRSIESGWCKEEYYRALSLSRTFHINVIPLLFEPVDLPGFLANRQYIDFGYDHDFETNIEALIWPGITGQKLAVAFAELECDPWSGNLGGSWASLFRIIEQSGVEMHAYSEGGISDHDICKLGASGTRVLYLVHPFGYWPWVDLDSDKASRRIKRILDLRETTRGTSTEVIFGLYMNPDALTQAPHGLPPETAKRLSKYFTIPMHFHDSDQASAPSESQEQELEESWNKIWLDFQFHCVRTERDFWGNDLEYKG